MSARRYRRGPFRGVGHATVVDTISANHTVRLVSQNASSVYATAIWADGRMIVKNWYGLTVQGVIHAPAQ